MRVLHATDLLPKSDASMERAALMAEQLGADLTLLHVVAPTETQRALEQELSLASAQMKSRTRAPLWRHAVKPNVIVKAGSPSQRILETIEEVGAHLLVLGPHRKRGLQDALAGTTAQRVLNARKIPVLIVREAPRGGYERALMALDLSPNSAEVLRAAEQLVSTSTTHSTVLHASELPYAGMLSYAGIDGITIDAYHGNWTQQARASVREFLERESANGSRYRVVIESARPATAILRAVRERRPRLLVLGTQGRGRIGRALLGSVANEVLREAQCDVLIVPNGSTRAPVHGSRVTQRMQPRLGAQPSPGM